MSFHSSLNYAVICKPVLLEQLLFTPDMASKIEYKDMSSSCWYVSEPDPLRNCDGEYVHKCEICEHHTQTKRAATFHVRTDHGCEPP